MENTTGDTTGPSLLNTDWLLLNTLLEELEMEEMELEVEVVDLRALARMDLRPFMLSVWVSGTDCGAGSVSQV